MCGISGYLNFQQKKSPTHVQGLIGKMNAKLAHRGPNNRGQWEDPENHCHLGHTRLSILDLSPAGHQPMLSSAGRYVISFNGEIYNYKELRKQIEKFGVKFQTNTDTEVLLQGFIHMGTMFFQIMDGMFAFAIYDRKTGILTLARDRVGEKPLYYAFGDSFFVFGSELKSILEVDDLPVSLSEESLTLFLTLRYVPSPLSILDPIRKLNPGTFLQINKQGGQHQEKYYAFEIDQDNEPPVENVEEYCDSLEEELLESLRGRLNSDVPLGMFLSSGVDSALACALLTQRLKKDVKTYTIGFSGDADSEHDAAKKISDILGTDHHSYIFTDEDFNSICDKIGNVLDEPNGDRSCVPTYLLSEFTKQHVTVAVSGDGGDELFGGYGRYPGFADAYDKAPHLNPREKVQTYIEQGLPVFPPESVRAAFPESYDSVLSFYEKYTPAFMHIRRPAIHALRQFDFHTYLPGAVLAKVDRMSMQHSLEVRTPFLAPKVLKLASQASEGLCWSGNVQKVALRKLLSRHLPDEHVYTKKKGFGMPPSVFFNNQQKVEAELRTAYNYLGSTKFFSQRKRGLDLIFGSASKNINAIWAVIVLSKWIQSVQRPL
jgi:asparagine synthase (glutamine-hydrolysing)